MFIFWPFTIISLTLSIIAIALNKRKILYISSILILPMSLYLAATPRFEVWGLIFPLLYVGAGISLKKKTRWLAFLLVVPIFLAFAWLGYIVINQ
ncbi:hypothetical protein PH210_19200 [Paenibacillus sp. BSR1-1]|uniref:hypothetical protein n=1 Tax=Paenibacillus sp. BSR1-1 TaxID=3020845 RepID=UPI0025B23DC8|nr:hypothetical protein [Paenibacillus sp. BSR1-1]MDN3018309.1 hypothetical protein [Paenibacillus sp. BSR1-1]